MPPPMSFDSLGYSERSTLYEARPFAQWSDEELWQAGYFVELVRRYTELFSACQRQHDGAGLHEVAHNLACALRAAGQFESAAGFQRIASKCERTKIGQGGTTCGMTLSHQGLDQLTGGDLHVAEALLHKAELIHLAEGAEAELAADYGNLGVVAALQGDFTAAAVYFWQALRRHRRLKDYFHLGIDLDHLGQIFESIDAFQTARRLYLKAAACFQKSGARSFYQQACRSAHRLPVRPLVPDRQADSARPPIGVAEWN